MKTTLLQLPDLFTSLFDGLAVIRADGWGPSGGRARTSDDNVELEVLDNIPFTTQAQGSSNPSPNSSTSGAQSHASTPNFEGVRPKKRARHSSKQSKISSLEEDKSNALKLIVKKK